MNHNHKKHGLGTAAAFLAGAATTAAVGGYLLYGPHGKRNRRKLDAWVAKAKEELLERLEEAEDMTETQYRKLVDQLTEKYAKLHDVGMLKAREAAQDFKQRFKEMKRQAKEARDEAQEELELEEEWAVMPRPQARDRARAPKVSAARARDSFR